MNDPTQSNLVLGIDGGGTKTVAWLAPLSDDGSGVILGRGHAGPGNPRAAGFETAQSNIDAAIASAFLNSGVPRQTVAAACFGLAGAGRQSEQDQIAAWAMGRQIATRVRVTGDAEPILAAAAGDLRGIALICGTGSLAWGRNQAGQIARCGGWGYLLGDEGSGYWIARAGLSAAMQAADSRGPPTMLLDSLLAELGGSSPEDLIERVYAPAMTRERLAGLCKIVFDLAEQDPVARTIIDTAASELAGMISALRSRLGFADEEYPLALAGSTVLSQPLLRSGLQQHLHAAHASPQNICLIPDPVRGALTLARSLVSSSP